MKRLSSSLAGLLLLAGLCAFGIVQALTASTSVRLSDTIAKGVGEINLLKDITPAQLEGYRASYGAGAAVAFGVDINEAASGSEKASSQGVTVADAWLEVGFGGGVTKTYGHAGNFYTETQALVMPAGATQRATYYTLLGESGSARISSANAIQSVFDSTLKIVVPDSLAGAVSAVLHVRLLPTSTKLGDPEAYYGFNAGFEDLALLAKADATYLDEVVPTETLFRADSPAVQLSPQATVTTAASTLSWVQKPGADSYFTVAYEDLYPNKGDYDFNDLVVAYRYQLGVNASGQVERIDGVAYLLARGSTYTHDWTLDIALPANAAAVAAAPGQPAACTTQNAAGAALPCSVGVADGRLRWAAFSDTVTAFPASASQPATPVNTPAGMVPVRGPKAVFSLTFANTSNTPLPTLASFGTDDPWLYVHGHTLNTVKLPKQEVHLSARNSSGLPFAMVMPSAWKVPVEGGDMGQAYTKLGSFIASSGSQSADWYLQPVSSLTHNWTSQGWAW